MGWIDLSQDRGRWGGSFECDDEPSNSLKCGECLH